MAERTVWNRTKAKENLLRHRVRFADGERVLNDPLAVTAEDRDHGEPRFRTLGADGSGRVLVVVWSATDGGQIRLISVRKASRQEREWLANERR